MQPAEMRLVSGTGYAATPDDDVSLLVDNSQLQFCANSVTGKRASVLWVMPFLSSHAMPQCLQAP